MILNLWLLTFWQLWRSERSVHQPSKRSQAKIYKYREIDRDSDFVIEPSPDGNTYIMTSHRFGLKLGDYVMIQSPSQEQPYRILEIDYYGGSHPDLWIAKLMPAKALVCLPH